VLEHGELTVVGGGKAFGAVVREDGVNPCTCHGGEYRMQVQGFSEGQFVGAGCVAGDLVLTFGAGQGLSDRPGRWCVVQRSSCRASERKVAQIVFTARGTLKALSCPGRASVSSARAASRKTPSVAACPRSASSAW